MAVFIEKSPVTRSNCYETVTDASLFNKLGTNVDWTIAFVTKSSIVNFLLPWQRGNILKLLKITILRWVFPKINNCFKRAATSRLKAISVGNTLPSDRPEANFSLSQVQNLHFERGRRRKCDIYKQHFSKLNSLGSK
jgi:hypothetical protein